MAKTFAEINEKIQKGEAVVLTVFATNATCSLQVLGQRVRTHDHVCRIKR